MEFNRIIENKIENSLKENDTDICCVLCGKKSIVFYKIRDEIKENIKSENRKYTRIFYAGYCEEHNEKYNEETKENILKKLILESPTYVVSEEDF